MNNVFDAYRGTQKLVGKEVPASEVQAALLKTIGFAAGFLSGKKRVELKSMVPGKSYFAFAKDNGTSRPVNTDLFLDDEGQASEVLETLFRGEMGGLTASSVNAAIYTASICFCAVIDLTKTRDPKTPGTFFEYLISAILEARLGCKPQTSIQVLNLDFETKLPTDLIFDSGVGHAKFHVPVKTSTRERVIQVWAHQRVLDGVYGTGRFLGMPVILTETKLDATKLEVTEICLPKQWLLYQMHIAQLWRIAFLDLPQAYAKLNDGFPKVPVCTLGELLCGSDLSNGK